MIDIAGILSMIERRAPVLMRAQSGKGAKIDVDKTFRTHDCQRKPWTRIQQCDVEEWKRLYVDKKMSSFEIGEKFNRDSSAIRYHLLRSGVKLRTRKEALSLK